MFNDSNRTKSISKKDWSSKLPHTKILVLGAVCISLIAIVVAYKVSVAKQSAIVSSNLLGVSGESSESSASDQRIVEALNDARISSLGSLASSSNPFIPTASDSLSDRFSKDVFAAYQRYEQNGGNVSEDDLSADPINNIDTSVLPKEKYTIAQLPVFVPSTTDDIKVYANTFASIYLADLVPVAQNPEKYSANLRGLTVIYKKVASDLIKIKTPIAIASEQVGLANGFSIMADSFPLVDGQEKDPVKALLGLRTVRDALQNQIALFTQISTYIDDNGILFEKGDAGIMWTQVAKSTAGSSNTSQ